MLDDFRDDEINTSTEFLDEFRQRLNSQPLDNVEQRRASVNRSQQIFLSALLGVGLAGVVSYFIFASDYSKVENVEIPVVRRPQVAVKVQPIEPGGMEILNQDKTVYDIVEKKAEDTDKVESVLPPPEEPDVQAIQPNINTAINVASRVEKILKSEDNKNRTEEVKEVSVEVSETETSVSLPSSEVSKETLPQVETAGVSEPNKPEINASKEVVVEQASSKTVEVKAAEVKKAETKAPEAKKSASSKDDIPYGVWQLQLISTPNSSAVEKAWKSMIVKYPALKDQPHEVETADLGSKGVYYRLKAGSFVDRGDADKLCNSIKNSGGTCLVKKK